MAMSWREYVDEVYECAKEAINEGAEYYEDFNEMWDALMIDDSVTGNGSGSFTFNTEKAKENISDLIFDEDTVRLFEWNGYEGIPMEKGPEAIDVILRCFALEDSWAELEECYLNRKIGLEVERNGQYLQIFDDDNCPTEWFINKTEDDTFNAYRIKDYEEKVLERVARIKNTHNTWTPFLDLDTGSMSDNVATLCESKEN